MVSLVCRFTAVLAVIAGCCLHAAAQEAEVGAAPPEKIIGMYIHQHWPYQRPYAARTWTLEDWDGYLDGLQRLGFNTVKIWPMLETMPKPLTASDAAQLEKLRQVIDLAHNRQMRVMIALCPNVIADDAVAAQMTFEERYFFYCDLRVNPGDPDAVRRMLEWREQLFRPLAKADAVAIIDSDPGGYPGSTNQEFVDLLAAHRSMFDRLRPGIELIYWVHAGWPAYCRYYERGKFAFGVESEFLDALERLAAANPEPWGLAGNIHWAKRAGIAERAIEYRYGAIEGEPSFPLTNFKVQKPYQAAQETAGRGVMGNAQTHCLQLPHTFAFARGARGLPLSDADFLAFANDLLPGHGALLVDGWSALWGGEPSQRLALADRLDALAQEEELVAGPLRGLLFGDARRLLEDLAAQLRLQAACDAFCTAAEADEPLAKPFNAFAREFASWQQRHGYQGRAKWIWPRLDAALDKLNAPEIDAPRTLEPLAHVPFAKVKEEYAMAETASSRLATAMVELAEKMNAEAD